MFLDPLIQGSHSFNERRAETKISETVKQQVYIMETTSIYNCKSRFTLSSFKYPRQGLMKFSILSISYIDTFRATDVNSIFLFSYYK